MSLLISHQSVKLARAVLQKPVLQLGAAVIVPFLTIGFLSAEHLGLWDRYFGLDTVLDIARNFETSYAEPVSRQVRPGEPGWEPMLDLIQRYSIAQLPSDRNPKVFARFVGFASKVDLGAGQFSEWTAPSTPIALVYADWPGHGAVPPTEYRIVGTIGDIRTWVDKRRSDVHFVVRDFLFALTSVLLGLVIWMLEHRPRRGIQEPDIMVDNTRVPNEHNNVIER